MSLFLALTIRAGRITHYQEIVKPICSPFRPALCLLAKIPETWSDFCKCTYSFQEFKEDFVNYSLWVNHSVHFAYVLFPVQYESAKFHGIVSVL